MTQAVYNRDWPRVRLEMLARDNYRCLLQGPHCKGVATEVDHIVPVDEGGSWRSPANLRSVCRPCHNGRKSRQLVIVSPASGSSLPSRAW